MAKQIDTSIQTCMKSDTRDKFQFVEGTRGIAALQVVVLHYCASFLPAFARVGTVTHFDWESRFGRTPLFFLADGYTAVFIFFLMSGFVLAPSLTSSSLSLQDKSPSVFSVFLSP